MFNCYVSLWVRQVFQCLLIKKYLQFCVIPPSPQKKNQCFCLVGGATCKNFVRCPSLPSWAGYDSQISRRVANKSPRKRLPVHQQGSRLASIMLAFLSSHLLAPPGATPTHLLPWWERGKGDSWAAWREQLLGFTALSPFPEGRISCLFPFDSKGPGRGKGGVHLR